MSGHNKWKQIKEKKAVADQKRSQVYSRMLKIITSAAREGGTNPNTNPKLKTAVDQAKNANVPHANIERALKRVDEVGDLESLVLEAYGPEGVAVLMLAETDSKNRTVQEIKTLLKEHDATWADPGSVRWAFEETNGAWAPKFPQEISEKASEQLARLVASLEEHQDIESVYTSATL